MPPKRKRRGRQKKIQDEQDDTGSDSGKLSETQEVARRLSRARLGKENSSKVLKTPVQSQTGSDSYDADSEPDVNTQATSMLCTEETCERVPNFRSTPNVQVMGNWSPLNTYSRVGTPQPPLTLGTQSSISISSVVSVSPLKRKPDVGFYDIPFTKPKRQKKKSKPVTEQKTSSVQDELDEMNIHFMEIEKLDLFVD